MELKTTAENTLLQRIHYSHQLIHVAVRVTSWFDQTQRVVELLFVKQRHICAIFWDILLLGIVLIVI